MPFLNAELFFFFFLVCGGPRLGSSFDASTGASRRLEPLRIIGKRETNLVVLHEPEGERESEREREQVVLFLSCSVNGWLYLTS